MRLHVRVLERLRNVRSAVDANRAADANSER